MLLHEPESRNEKALSESSSSNRENSLNPLQSSSPAIGEKKPDVVVVGSIAVADGDDDSPAPAAAAAAAATDEEEEGLQVSSRGIAGVWP